VPRSLATPRSSTRRRTGDGAWDDHVHYGVWQLPDPVAAPGVWCTDLVSGTRRCHAGTLSSRRRRSMGRRPGRCGWARSCRWTGSGAAPATAPGSAL
jgi:hypothetical protein